MFVGPSPLGYSLAAVGRERVALAMPKPTAAS